MSRLDELARYVAGPLALASLGVALWGVDLAAAASIAWLFVVAWAVAAVVGWLRERLDLKRRAIRLANRVRRCVPGWWGQPDFRPQSVYGDDVSMAQFLVGMQSLQRRRVHPFWKRRYTKRLHDKVVEAIEDIGRAGVIDNHLKPYLTDLPQPGQYDDLARELWWAACKLP